MTRVGVVTGLASEAEILEAFSADHRPKIAVAGASAVRAEAAANRLIDEGCGAILSFGVAGGLDPALRPGTVVIADAIVAPDGTRLACDVAWHGRVLQFLSGNVPCFSGALAGSDEPLLSPQAKAALGRRWGAVAVDMESHGVARAARARNVPFLALRAVADGAERVLPAWVMDAVLPDGSLAPGKIARALLPRPWQVWGLIGLARANGRALGALGRVASRLGPGLGLAG